jgi:hypothetical protein
MFHITTILIFHLILLLLHVGLRIYLSICGLFNDASNRSDYIASNNRMTNELEIRGKNLVCPNYWYCPGISREGLKKTMRTLVKVAAEI